MAAHEIWDQACARARAVLGDHAEAAEMMELSVERVSHYLNRHAVLLFAVPLNGLLTTAFRRQVQKRRRKTERLELLGGSADLDEQLHTPDWSADINWQLDLSKIVRRLSQRSIRILLRRRDGVGWKSIAQELGIPESTAQNSFWREVRQAQLNVHRTHNRNKESGKKEGRGEMGKRPKSCESNNR
jgi:DNA-directed RNA polymerase specialized sigma24 family protein